MTPMMRSCVPRNVPILSRDPSAGQEPRTKSDRGEPLSSPSRSVSDGSVADPESVTDGSYAASVAPQRNARCAHCGEAFVVTNRSGPDPTYCSQAHRQAAYQARRRATRTDDQLALDEELARLRSRISWLEHDNELLRRERDDATAELIRLQDPLNPPSAAVRMLRAQGGHDPYPTLPSPPRKRWKLSR